MLFTSNTKFKEMNMKRIICTKKVITLSLFIFCALLVFYTLNVFQNLKIACNQLSILECYSYYAELNEESKNKNNDKENRENIELNKRARVAYLHKTISNNKIENISSEIKTNSVIKLLECEDEKSQSFEIFSLDKNVRDIQYFTQKVKDSNNKTYLTVDFFKKTKNGLVSDFETKYIIVLYCK